MKPYRRLATDLAIAGLALFALAGCMKPVLVFGTGTKFGLDASQRADQLVEITMGYDRYELASIPARKNPEGEIIDAKVNSAGVVQDDTYSVLGVFSFSYGNPFGDEPLVLRQFFATGMAARKATQKPGFQQFFGHKTGEIIRDAEAETRQNRTRP
jgi:hypothetical protein